MLDTFRSGVDNDTRRIDQARLGAVAAVDTTTNGTLYFDAFESRRSTYIGPMPSPVVTTTITYVYDPLYRLKEANYSDGRYFRYTYDSVGNRLSETKCAVLPCTTPITNTYVYDSANRLTSVNGQTYTWDNNGNLTNDGTSTYVYDAANRLTSVTQGTTLSSYTYNGLGDRLSQTVNSVTTNYVLDLNAGLTQVLSDGTNTYLYGNGRIGELQPGGFAYHLGDALGSVRQLTDGSGGVTLARSFEPYGNTLSTSSNGTSNTVWQFTGEQRDASGLTFLRARYLSSQTGRFTSKDTWRDYSRPLTLNGWNYTDGNPINRVDPNGHWWWGSGATLYENSFRRFQSQNVHVRIQGLWMLGREEEIHAEYIIPGTNLPVDLLDSISGEMWEIKPWADRVDALAEINARVPAMIAARNAELLTGMAPNVELYNWNYSPVTWYYGRSFPAEVYIGTDETGNYDIYAGQTDSGVIAWWKYKRARPLQVPDPIYLPWAMKRSERNERPDWQPSAAPVGAAATTWDDPSVIRTCETALAVVITAGILLNPVPGDELVLPIVWARVFSH